MLSFVATILTILTVSAVINPSLAFVEGRDNWYKLNKTYTDLPRVFDDSCPARKFYFNCNKCTCDENKVIKCTEEVCPEIPQIINWQNGKNCPAKKRFYWKCNDCDCGRGGKDAICTKKYCPNFDIYTGESSRSAFKESKIRPPR